MPIVIKNFKWKQTDTNIIIDVPMPSMHISKADVLISTRYLKASHEAYFFEVILLNDIDAKASKCTKTNNNIIFELQKCESIWWDCLEVNLPKHEKMDFKKKFLEKESEKIIKEHENKVNKKAELKRAAVGAQIELDTKTRNKIDKIKKQEETLALGDLNNWKNDVKNSQANIVSSCEIKELDDLKISKTISNSNIKKTALNYIKKDSIVHNKIANKPRSTRSLQILFTEREFPTPSRESRLEEENEFLRKQAEVRRSVGFNSKDLRPEEKSPQFLLDKGREFMSVQNYLGAISAYSFGLKLSPEFLDLYIARSEANLLMGNFNNCVEDTSSALNLLKPALPINLEQRAICIGRRGLALVKLGFFKHGIAELEASLKLKNDKTFEQALKEAKEEFEIKKTNERN